MQYPVYVHLGGEGEADGATIPDFPGCFTAVDDLEDLADSVQEALEVYFDGEDLKIPDPTPIGSLMTDPDYTDGYWMMVDVNTIKLLGQTKRINITMPERLLMEVDAYAKQSGETRSGLLAEAAAEYLERNRG